MWQDGNIPSICSSTRNHQIFAKFLCSEDVNAAENNLALCFRYSQSFKNLALMLRNSRSLLFFKSCKFPRIISVFNKCSKLLKKIFIVSYELQPPLFLAESTFFNALLNLGVHLFTDRLAQVRTVTFPRRDSYDERKIRVQYYGRMA